MTTTTANVLVVIAWAMTIALVTNLLGGVFDGRQCQTLCFSLLYWGALAVAVIGVLVSLRQLITVDTGWISKIIFLLGLALIIKLMGIMVIGNLAT
jgi:hypothetical protein